MIGIFDSGSGGLTVLKAMREVLPSSDVVYFGDIKNAPYGSKSRAELSALTVDAIKLLQSRGADRILSACNSVSASLAISLFDAFSIAPNDLIEMVGPTVAYFRGSPARILLCATPATIESGIYQNAFTMVGKTITALPMPELASAIEFGEEQEKIHSIIQKVFADVPLKDFDVLILACTHYPLVSHVFEQLAPETLAIFDPAVAVADRVLKQWWPMEVGGGKTTFLISQDSGPFRALVARLFPHTAYSIEVLR